jgi:5-methylcytosine-specific restriction endonuclease McrA
MRPLLRGGVSGSGYQLDIDLSSQNELQKTLSNYTMKFNIQAVKDLWKTDKPTTWQMLNTATQYLLGGGTPAERKLFEAATDRVYSQLRDKGYATAATPLANRIAKNCCYCDQFLPDEVDLEHCVPKAQYPEFWLCWDNFLLACKACNGSGTGKGDGPNRATVQGWKVLPKSPTEVDYYDAIRNQYIWPDLAKDAYTGLLPTLAYDSTGKGNWVAVPDADSVRDGIAITVLSPADRSVTAKLSIAGGKAKNYTVVVLFNPIGRGNVTIPYFGLDKGGDGTGSIRDFRMYNRTKSWFKAAQLVRPLTTVTTTAEFNAAESNLLAAMSDTGQFSTWIRVLCLVVGQGTLVPGKKDTIVTTVIGHMNNHLIGYPGTDLQYVP